MLTGGTSGIGLAMVEQLLEQGHQLIVVSRSSDTLSRLKENSEQVATYACDLSSRQQTESLIETIKKSHPELSVVINNAGVQYTPMLLDQDFDLDSVEFEIKVNFVAPVWISYLLLPTLIKQTAPAAIVNISSGLAFAPKTGSAVYCATKAAIHSISQSLRYQLAGTNVQICEAILPLVDTPMTAGRGGDKLSAHEAARQIIRGVKHGKPEIYVGKARLLKPLMRLSPTLVKRIMRRY
ncbi:MAG: SDR family NAD(P)-dependent oxidoreductase [Thiohalocapsa sp. PB-PSB1]|nr:MAG: SDR family NAD(P)-dependent oxidoreductase [Thiohalocapsa sp. PB-PSB1]